MFKKGETAYRIAANGAIQTVIVTEDERGGVVKVQGASSGGAITDVGTFNLFRSQMAANRAALVKSQPATPPSPGLFVRSPK